MNRKRLKRWVAHARRRLARAVERPGDGIGGGSAAFRELVALAWPIATTMLSETLLGLVDTKLVAGLGASALGGVGIATVLMFLNYSIVLGVMRAVKSRTAIAVGEGRPGEGSRYAAAGIGLSLAWGAMVWRVGRDLGPMLRLIHVDAAIVPYARDFFAAVTWGAPATCVLATLVNHRQAVGDTRTPMVVGIAGNVINATVSYALIHGCLGLPALGVAGSGYGTAIAEWLEAIAMLAVFARDARRTPGTLPLPRALREILVVGLPTGLHFGTELIAFTALSAIIGNIGSVDIAAHQIAMASVRVSFLPGIAIGEASCILVGRALGRRRLAEADRAHRAAILLAIAFMATCGVVFATLGGAIAAGFTPDADVVRTARRLLLVAALFQVIDACNVVLRGSLRGAEDVRATAVIGIASVWLFVPTCGFVLGKLAGWGALGGWIGFLFETSFGAALFARRWSRGGWRAKHRAAASASDPPLSLRAAPVSG